MKYKKQKKKKRISQKRNGKKSFGKNFLPPYRYICYISATYKRAIIRVKHLTLNVEVERGEGGVATIRGLRCDLCWWEEELIKQKMCPIWVEIERASLRLAPARAMPGYAVLSSLPVCRFAVARHPRICLTNKSKLFIYFLISTSFAVCIFCCSVCAENAGADCRLLAFKQGVIIGKIILFEWECMSARIDEYASDDWAPISFVFDVKMELYICEQLVGMHFILVMESNEIYTWIKWKISKMRKKIRGDRKREILIQFRLEEILTGLILNLKRITNPFAPYIGKPWQICCGKPCSPPPPLPPKSHSFYHKI